MLIGDIIKFLRNERGLTQKEMAAILNVKISSIQKYESNSVPNLKMDTIRKLCDYFDVLPFVFIFPEEIKSAELINYYSKKLIHPLCSLNIDGLTKLTSYTKDLIDSGNYKI